MWGRFKNIFLAILSGLLIGSAFPPFDFTMGAFVGLVPLLYLEHQFSEEKKSKWKLFLLAYVAFVVWNAVACWWIYYAAQWGGLAFEVLANSLLFALMFLLFHFVKKHISKTFWPFALIALWVSLEFLHFQNWELSWPWLSLGNVFANRPYLIQWYEFTGVLGGSAWVLGMNWLLFLCLKEWKINRAFNTHVFRRFIHADFLLLAPIVISVGLYLTYIEETNPVKVLVVQPNIDPYGEKFGAMGSVQQLEKAAALAAQKIDDSTSYMVLPETAIHGNNLWEGKLHVTREIGVLAEIVNKHPQLHIVSGISSDALVYPKDKQNLPPSYRKFGDADEYYESYNAAVQIDSSFTFPMYHKSLLVMGAERVPFETIFPSLKELSMDFGGTFGTLGTQKSRSNFSSLNGKIQVAPIICYESIYSDYVTEYVRKGANLLFIVTNDGWWDDTPGYKQHFAYARIRAIENRRSVARSANTGISGFINQKGDVLSQTEWWKPDAISATINANSNETLFTKFPYLVGGVAVSSSFIFLILAVVNQQRKKSIK